MNAAFFILIEYKYQKRQNFDSRPLSMEVEVGMAPFVVSKDFVSCFLVCVLPANLNQTGLKTLILGNI